MKNKIDFTEKVIELVVNLCRLIMLIIFVLGGFAIIGAIVEYIATTMPVFLIVSGGIVLIYIILVITFDLQEKEENNK